MQIPILSGVYTDKYADFRTSYPVNLVPVPMDNGISKGYLRPAEGAIKNGDGPGVSRGGISWNGLIYRVMGTKFISIDELNNITIIGDVGSGVHCSMDYSFDRLAVVSGGRAYYWDGSVFKQISDSDLGQVIGVCWIDGYFVYTDGQFIISTELSDPFSINPLKYGSSEMDPDPIYAVRKVRNELHVVNRYTIEVFQNIGGDYFPFSRMSGAHFNKGSIGPSASCVFMDSIAFIGSGRNESCSVYIGSNASTIKIGTKDIDSILSKYKESELYTTHLERKNSNGGNQLLMHLPDMTLVYDFETSKVVGENIWYVLSSSQTGIGKYTPRDLVWCFNKWCVASSDSTSFGYLSDEVSSHWGDLVHWEFGTQILYAEGFGAIIHSIELVCLTGRVLNGIEPQISTCYSLDGVSWSQDKYVSIGTVGDRQKRIVWLRNGRVRSYRIQKFKGNSDSFISISRLEIQIEKLSV